MYVYLFVALIISGDSADDDARSNGANGVDVECQDVVAGTSGAVANGANGVDVEHQDTMVTVQADVHDPPLMLPQMVDGE